MAHKRHSTNECLNEKGNLGLDLALSLTSQLCTFDNLLLPQAQFLHL